MSRWSAEEDKCILESIREVRDEINYSELVGFHNETYGTKRTEDTYKVRVRKIAKENDIILKSSHWTEDERVYIITSIKKNPFGVDMNELSGYLKRSEASVKKMYTELVSPEEHLECCLLHLHTEEIMKLINDIRHTCIKCHKTMYSNPNMWEDLEYCDECYYESFYEQIMQRWIDVREYSVQNNKDRCNICDKVAVFDKYLQSKFHYDHMDMFDKSESICVMVKNGTMMSDIYHEIDKCQLLCVSCHTIVTKVEILCGFNRVKRQVTKEYNETSDGAVRESLMKKYSEKYNEFMSGVYKKIKEII